MRIQVVSDLHLEFHNLLPSVAEGADVLVCAGDLAPIGAGTVRYAAEEWAEARHILYVPCNHEFHGADIDRARKQLAEECPQTRHRCSTPTRSSSTTSASSARRCGPISCSMGSRTSPGAHRAALGISDFDGWILHEKGTGRFTTHESARRHAEERAFIEAELADAARDGTTAVVITHHSPTPRSIAPRFLGNTLNPAFASNLEPLIAQSLPQPRACWSSHSSRAPKAITCRALAGNCPGLPLKKGRRENLRPHSGSGGARFETYFASDFES